MSTWINDVSRVIPGRSAHTFGDGIQVVWAITKRFNVLGESDARLQLGIQQIAFVQEEHKFDICQKLVAAYRFP